MKIKNKEELEWSSIVANNSMNRERKAIGINSYEKDIYLNPVEFINAGLPKGNISWMDLCCGQGNALIEVAKLFSGKKLENNLSMQGVDLVDFFNDYEEYKDFLLLKKMNLEDWIPEEDYDLITIVHGLHYIGDKLNLLKKAMESLKKKGILIANLDLNNIKINGKDDSLSLIKRYFKKENLNYNSRRKILKIEGKRSLNVPFKYIGANDEAGPNYSGQNSVDSVYGVS